MVHGINCTALPPHFTLYSFEYQVGEAGAGGVLELSFVRYVPLLRAPTLL